MGKLQQLAQELDAGHPVTGEYSSNAQVAADQINATNRTKTERIGSAELLSWSAKSSTSDRPRIIKIQEGKSNANETCVALCFAAEQMIMRDNTGLDLSLSDRVQMLDSLVSFGILSAADKTDLEQLSQTSISRSDELNLGVVKAGTIEQARNL